MRLLLLVCLLAGCGQLLLEEQRPDSSLDADPGVDVALDTAAGDTGDSAMDGGRGADIELSDAPVPLDSLPVSPDATDAGPPIVASDSAVGTDATPTIPLVGADASERARVVGSTRIQTGTLIAANDRLERGLIYFARGSVAWNNRLDRGALASIASDGPNAVAVGVSGRNPLVAVINETAITRVGVLDIDGDLRSVDADATGFVAGGTNADHGLVVVGTFDGRPVEAFRVLYSGLLEIEGVVLQGETLFTLGFDPNTSTNLVSAFDRASLDHRWSMGVRGERGHTLRGVPAGRLVMLTARSMRTFRQDDGALEDHLSFDTVELRDLVVADGVSHTLFHDGDTLVNTTNFGGEFRGPTLPYTNGNFVKDSRIVVGNPSSEAFVQVLPFDTSAPDCPAREVRINADALDSNVTAVTSPRATPLVVVETNERASDLPVVEHTTCR